MNPREFQKVAMGRVGNAFREGKKAVLLVSPTGSGKTCMGSMMVARFVAAGKRVAWGAHRSELLDQAARTLSSFGLAVGYAGIGPSAPVQLGTFQEWTSRGKAPDADVFVPDEAHHMGDKVGWQAIPRAYKDQGAKIIGLTATPSRADGRSLPDFEEIVVAAQIAELQELGLLVSLKWRGPSADQIIRPGYIARRPVDAYLEEAAGRCAVVFASNTVAARAFVDEFIAAGVTCRLVTGTMSRADRAQALEDHASGAVSVLVNVAVLTEGWDNTRCDCVIVARGCESPGLWIQMAGRGLRPHTGKTECILLDLKGLAHTLGRPDAPAEYSLDPDGQGIVLRSDAATGPRLCKVCKRVMGDRELLCLECGHDHTPKVPKAADAPLTDWEEGWAATRDALKVSRPVMALAGILRKQFESESAGKPWKRGAAAFRFSFIFKRQPFASEMAQAMNFVRSVQKYSAVRGEAAE
jgi:superfamily II DNA or RNA helicase